MYFIAVLTAAGVVTGTPVAGFTPVAMEVMFAEGSPFISSFTQVVCVTTPVQAGPLTGDAAVATGNPITR
ncbi:MAG: hypothetical protein MSQ05_07405 [Akkermansia sp.]|nr:hypothetical protein [Akkermansia sp.]